MMKKLILLFLVLLAVDTAQAQSGEGRRRNMDPVKMAARQTEAMTRELSLDESQIAAVDTINLKYAHAQKEVWQQPGDFSAKRDMMLDLRLAQDKELKKVMTKDQFKTWRAYRKKMREERMQQRENRPDRPISPAPSPNG
ncbi:MAG: hypothetical protein AAGI38_16325 [Bacteroidota bacterium]